MATFSDQNYQDLIDILGLPPSELEQYSDLRQKARRLEDRDVRLQTRNVGRVQKAIYDYLKAEESFNCAFESDDDLGTSSASVSGEYSVSYSQGGLARSRYLNYQAAMNRNRQTIIRYLQWIESSPYTGRVLRGVS